MNIEPRSAKGRHRVAAARSSRRTAEADVIIVPFHGACSSFSLHWCSSDLPILGWHFGHERNHHKAHYAACSQEKKAVGDCESVGLLATCSPRASAARPIAVRPVECGENACRRPRSLESVRLFPSWIFCPSMFEWNSSRTAMKCPINVDPSHPQTNG